VWPLEPRGDALLRIGRDRIELWRQQTGELAGTAALAAPLDVAALEEAIGQVLRVTPALRHVRAVVESAWAPVMALPVGAWRWSMRATLTALLRHRLDALYGNAAEPMASWALRLDYRPGDSLCLGYALRPAVRLAVEQATAARGVGLTSLLPALAWSRTAAPRRTQPANGWWLWQEQDRTLVARIQQQEVMGFQPAAPVLSASLDARRLVQIEALRAGLEEGGAIVISGWETPSRQEHGVAWAPALATRAVAASKAAVTA
jgi:hypothetical protein